MAVVSSIPDVCHIKWSSKSLTMLASGPVIKCVQRGTTVHDAAHATMAARAPFEKSCAAFRARIPVAAWARYTSCAMQPLAPLSSVDATTCKL